VLAGGSSSSSRSSSSTSDRPNVRLAVFFTLTIGLDRIAALREKQKKGEYLMWDGVKKFYDPHTPHTPHKPHKPHKPHATHTLDTPAAAVAAATYMGVSPDDDDLYFKRSTHMPWVAEAEGVTNAQIYFKSDLDAAVLAARINALAALADRKGFEVGRAFAILPLEIA
jgi:hypothetical protein